MTQILLFHHAAGLTPGFLGFADALRDAGHTVHAPDLYDGATFDTVDAGVDHARSLGFQAVFEKGVAAAQDLDSELVVMGVSLGVMPAQSIAQNSPGVRGAVFLEGCAPVEEFGTWPAGLPVQVHGMDADPFFAGEGDVDAARALVAGAVDGELFLYPGDQHLFTDPSMPGYHAEAAGLMTERVLAFLERVG